MTSIDLGVRNVVEYDLSDGMHGTPMAKEEAASGRAGSLRMIRIRMHLHLMHLSHFHLFA